MCAWLGQCIFVAFVSYYGGMSKGQSEGVTFAEKNRECQKTSRQLVNWDFFACFMQIFLLILMGLNVFDYRWLFAVSAASFAIFLIVDRVLSKKAGRLHQECLALLRS